MAESREAWGVSREIAGKLEAHKIYFARYDWMAILRCMPCQELKFVLRVLCNLKNSRRHPSGGVFDIVISPVQLTAGAVGTTIIVGLGVE